MAIHREDVVVLAVDWASIGVAAGALAWTIVWAIFSHQRDEARRGENALQDQLIQQLQSDRHQVLERMADAWAAIVKILGGEADLALEQAQREGADVRSPLLIGREAATSCSSFFLEVEVCR